MSKIFDLINELCPKGVEFRELGDIADIGTGSSNRQDEDSNGKYPFYVRSKNILKSNTFEFDETAIIIPGEGGIGDIFHYIDGKYALHQRAYRICVFCKKIDTKFLYYIMCCHFKKYILAKSVGATATSIRKPMLEKFKLPVPPMEVQREIVRIMDSFTSLTEEFMAKLTEELTARKKQYEFYRDFLLSFDELDKNGGCELKTLGEICELIRGNGLQKKDFVESGVPAIHYGQIYTYYGTFASKTKSFVSVDTARRLKKATKGDVLISGVSENIQDILKPLGWLGEEVAISGDMFALRPNKVVNTKFLTYMLQTNSFYKFKEKHAQGAKVTRVKSDRFLKFKIPVPSLQTQQKVIEILDKFDTLVNSITEGLPREIELRRKQYEHYRELLLNFKPKMRA